MKTMSMKLVIMMAVCLNLTACGKSKSDGGVQAAPTVTAPTTPAIPATDPVKNQDQNQDQNQKDPNVPTTTDAKIHTKITNLEDGQSQPQTEDVGIPSLNDDMKDKKDKKAGRKQSQGETQTQIETSGNSTIDQLRKEANKFSGAGDDYLRSFLMNKERALSQSQQINNLKAAQTIQNAVLKMDRPQLDRNGRLISNGTGDVAISLTIGSAKNKRTVVLGGLMKSDRTSKLRSVKENIKADLKCMDASVIGCEVALVNFQLNSGNVNIIFRRTAVKIENDFDRKACMTQECEDIYTMFRESDAAVDIVDVKQIVDSKML